VDPVGLHPHHSNEKKIRWKKLGERIWTGFIFVRVETSGGPCESSNEPSGSIEGRECFD
jgi:hypothetical protein